MVEVDKLPYTCQVVAVWGANLIETTTDTLEKKSRFQTRTQSESESLYQCTTWPFGSSVKVSEFDVSIFFYLDEINENFRLLNSQHGCVVVTNSCFVTQSLINYGTTVNGCHTSSGMTASHQTLNKLFSHLLNPITWNSMLVFSSPLSSATLQEATQSGRRDPNLWEWLQFSVLYFSLFYYLRL